MSTVSERNFLKAHLGGNGDFGPILRSHGLELLANDGLGRSQAIHLCRVVEGQVLGEESSPHCFHSGQVARLVVLPHHLHSSMSANASPGIQDLTVSPQLQAPSAMAGTESGPFWPARVRFTGSFDMALVVV